MIERKERLRHILPKDSLLAFSEHRKQHGTKYVKEADKEGLEGIMAKLAGSSYLSGQRSKDWLKIKTARRQELVIVGFTAPRRSRPYFGSLVLALREGQPGAMSLSAPGLPAFSKALANSAAADRASPFEGAREG